MFSQLRKPYHTMRDLAIRFWASWCSERHLAEPYLLKLTPERRQTLVFVHIPKTAGTTLLRILQRISSSAGEFSLRVPVAAYQPPVFIRPGWCGAWSSLERFSAYQLRGYQVISGHFPVGLHEKLLQTSHYITLIRDPIERELSSFNHHFERGYLNKNDSIAELLKDARLADNPQTRMLAGAEACALDQCTAATYATALKNLSDKFLLVGVQERFNEFISALLAIHGWPAVSYSRQRVTRVRQLTCIEENMRETLAEFHSFDVLLYEESKRRWAEWMRKHVGSEQRYKPEQRLLHIPWHSEHTDAYTMRTRHPKGERQWH